MEFQEIPENPNFNTEVRKITENTLAHADIMNEFLSTLIQNDTFLKNLADTIMENVNATYQQSTGYTDKKISELINGAPTTLDTLKEVADAIQNNQTVVEALDTAIGTKAAKVEFDSHEGNGSIHITPDEKQAIRNNTSQNVSFANNINGINANLATLWGDNKISTGGTSTNLSPSHFSGVAATWYKIGRLVILNCSCQRTSTANIAVLAIKGIPVSVGRDEITWDTVISTDGYCAYGYLENDCVSFYSTKFTTHGYYRASVVYISQS